LVAFLDAGCVPQAGWLDALLPHFADDHVVATAPRVRSTAGDSALARYERVRSPLDLGDREGPVRPGSWVPYVPSAALVVRRDVLVQTGGFDESMRYGEDVDLVWRLHERGLEVRFVPTAVVEHPPRPTVGDWLRQRFHYGTAAARLAQQHGAAVAPVAMSRWTAAAWAIAAWGQPLVGAAVAVGAAAPLRERLPGAEVARLTAIGHLQAGLRLLEGVRRTWWPITAAAALLSRRGRRLAALSAVPLTADWARDGRPVGLPAYVMLRLADDLAYGTGVWVGCRRAGSLAALRPTLS
jgi:mycofactocin system glycosyltransferase